MRFELPSTFSIATEEIIAVAMTRCEILPVAGCLRVETPCHVILKQDVGRGEWLHRAERESVVDGYFLNIGRLCGEY